MKPLCSLCGSRHELYQAHVFASSASNRVRASVTGLASNEGDRNGDRNGCGKGNRVWREPVQGSAAEMEKVGRGGKNGLQRDLQCDVAKPAVVPAPASGQIKPGDVAGNVLERGLDRGGRSQKQRWLRASYNAYQRIYMQTVRAVRAGTAELIRNRPEGVVA